MPGSTSTSTPRCAVGRGRRAASMTALAMANMPGSPEDTTTTSATVGGQGQTRAGPGPPRRGCPTGGAGRRSATGTRSRYGAVADEVGGSASGRSVTAGRRQSARPGPRPTTVERARSPGLGHAAGGRGPAAGHQHQREVRHGPRRRRSRRGAAPAAPRAAGPLDVVRHRPRRRRPLDRRPHRRRGAAPSFIITAASAAAAAASRLGRVLQARDDGERLVARRRAACRAAAAAALNRRHAGHDRDGVPAGARRSWRYM